MLLQLTESAGWWMGDDNSHGVEISIAGSVRKMVRDPTPKRIACVILMTHNYESCAKVIHHMTTIVCHVSINK